MTKSDDQATSGARTKRRARTVVPYDFSRPLQLSREHSRLLQYAFDGFARQATTMFTSSLRTVCQVNLISIGQRSYAEYVESLGDSTYMTLFTAEPMSGQGVLQMPLPAAMASVDHMLGGPGSKQQPDRPLTEIESGVIRGFIERLLGEMRYSLEPIVEMQPAVTGVEYSPQFAQVAATADVMVVTELELRLAESEHRITICLPFSGILPHLRAAAEPAPVSDREITKRAQAAAQLEAQFGQVPVEVSVRLRRASIDPEVLSNLKPNDILPLRHPASAPLEVGVAGTTFAHATSGIRGQQLAALIVTTPKEIA